MFTIKKKRTLPQALLIASVVLMLLFLGVCMETLTLVPTYATFGSQRTSGAHCSLSSLAQTSPDRCIMTTTSRFFNKYFPLRISLSIPTFTVATFALNWLFSAVFLISFAAGAAKKPQSDFDEEQEEDEEEDPLLV